MACHPNKYNINIFANIKNTNISTNNGTYIVPFKSSYATALVTSQLLKFVEYNQNKNICIEDFYQYLDRTYDKESIDSLIEKESPFKSDHCHLCRYKNEYFMCKINKKDLIHHSYQLLNYMKNHKLNKENNSDIDFCFLENNRAVEKNLLRKIALMQAIKFKKLSKEATIIKETKKIKNIIDVAEKNFGSVPFSRNLCGYCYGIELIDLYSDYKKLAMLYGSNQLIEVVFD